MAEYSKEEWQRLIEQYNRDMMLQYATAPQAQTTPPPDPAEPPQDIMSEPPEKLQSPKPQATPSNNVVTEIGDPYREYSDIGYLQVRASTENQAIPIEGAVVTVSHQNGDRIVLDRTMVTDRDGLTPIIELPTKDRALSLVPGNITPYAVYTVNITADGYFAKRFSDMPIYGGVTAIQSVSMIPLPEAGDNDMVLLYPQSGPSVY